MQKPQSLRAHLVAANPKLKNDPDKLHLFVDTGNALGTATEGHSFAYRYTVTILIMDYEGEVDALMVPLLAWVKVYQPELVANLDKRQTGIKFEVDFNNNKTADISIEMELTESRIVTKDVNGGSQHPRRQGGATHAGLFGSGILDTAGRRRHPAR